MLNNLLYHGVRILALLFGSIPKAAHNNIAAFLGRILYAFDRRHRNIALSNLRMAFANEKSEAEIRTIARKVFENLCKILFEVAWSLRLDKSEYPKYFRVSGIEEYKRILARGKGVLGLGAHFGNWELVSIIGYMYNLTANVLYRPLDAPFLDRFMLENRTRFGGKIIATHRGVIRGILRALKRGESVGLLFDQNVDWFEGVFVNFFNRRACTNLGLARLALKSKAPVVPIFMVREPKGFCAVFGPELPLIETGDRTKDVEANSQMYNDVIEIYARKFPDQWFWVHQRWKTRSYAPWPRQIET